MPVDKCEYIIDSINNFMNNETSDGRQAFMNNRLRLKIGELATKHFSYKHDQGAILIQLTDQLVRYKFFDNMDSIRKMEAVQ